MCGARVARFGTALVPAGLVKLKHAKMASDMGPIDPSCECFVCKRCMLDETATPMALLGVGGCWGGVCEESASKDPVS